MEPYIRSHRVPCLCFRKRLPLQLSSEQSVGDVAELSMGWVDPWVGLGRDFSVFGELGWVGSTTEKVLKI